MLAAKVLLDQGVEVVALCFKSNFYNCEKARYAAKQLDIDLREYDISKNMVELVKNPPSGYGKNLNPCIDCHSMMIKLAGRIAKEEDFDFVATGEVLGQRPFSQNRRSLARVAELSGVDVLRPLSAKLLPVTDVEKKGLVRRGLLLDIKGRTRERQFELIEKFGIKEYASPSGGCILTDPEFSERLGRMLEYWPECNDNDIELLKNGRVVWLKDKKKKNVLLVTGRHKEDNENLTGLIKTGDVIIELKEIKGPTSVLRGLSSVQIENITSINIPKELKKSELSLLNSKNNNEIIEIAALFNGYYATKARDKEVGFDIKLVE